MQESEEKGQDQNCLGRLLLWCVPGNSWKKSLADWKDLSLSALSCHTFSPSLPFWTVRSRRFAKAKSSCLHMHIPVCAGTLQDKKVCCCMDTNRERALPTHPGEPALSKWQVALLPAFEMLLKAGGGWFFPSRCCFLLEVCGQGKFRVHCFKCCWTANSACEKR